jgi:hypothetical protein
VGGGAVGIVLRETRGGDDAVAHGGAVERLGGQRAHGDAGLHAHAAAIAQVGQDAQAGPPARQPRHLLAQRLRDRVHHVGAHRVAAVDVHVDDDAAGMRAHLQLPRAAAAIGEAGQGRVRQRQQLGAGRLHAFPGGVRIVDADDLDLRGHHRIVRLGDEAAALAHHARGVRCRGDHRRLLDRHRHQDVAAVDDEVQADPERQRVDADRVLDHAIRDRGVDAAAVQRPHVLFRQVRVQAQQPPPLGHRESVETRNA